MASASFSSVVEMFHHRCRSTPDTDAMYYKVNGEWKTMVWREAGRRARNIACGLRARGIKVEERCAILSSTRMEWVLCDMGILAAGAATTTIYPSNRPDECEYILNDSSTRMVFVENQKQADKILSVRGSLPGVELLIVIDGTASADGFVVTLATVEAEGDAWDKANPGQYDAITSAIKSESLATLMYTSGTTGNPKGVMLDHDCWVYQGEAIDTMGILTPSDKQLLFLPLAHSFAKVLEIAFIRVGTPTAIDGDIDALAANLIALQPTVMGAVPRVYEKLYNKIVSGAREGGSLKWAIFQWALGVGREVSGLRQKGQEPGGFLVLKHTIADRLVFSKIKQKVGGRARFFISGGAPLSREIGEFFHAIDVLILEGYGLTETSAGAFFNRPDSYRFGTVGQAFPGTEVRIAADGEILIRGRHVMQGYYNRPQETAETLEADGWFHTGDIGHLEEGGFLKITDRKKDLIKTSGGKYVAPQEVENRLKTRSTLISQVLVHGDNRNFCSLLVTLSADNAPSWFKRHGMEPVGYEALIRHPKVLEEIQRVVNEVNAELPPHASLKKFAILPKDFSQEDDDMTPTLKIKRKNVQAKYKEILDGFYVGASASM